MDYEFKFKHAGMQHDTIYTGTYMEGDELVLMTWNVNGTEHVYHWSVESAINLIESNTWVLLDGKYKAANPSKETLLERIKRFTEATRGVVSVVGGKFEVVASGEVYNGLSDDAVVELMDALEVVKKYE
jgi:hypothetical protein